MDTALNIAAIIFGSALLTFIQFLITRKDKKKEKEEAEKKDNPIKKLETQLRQLELKQERDSLRIQMLILMNHYPNDSRQLLMLGERYFVELQGDWYMSSLFEEHCKSNGIPLPNWFHSEKN